MEYWRNWSGSVVCQPQESLSIANETALVEAIRNAPGPIRVLGAGHSFTPLLACEGTHLTLSGMTGVTPDPQGIRIGAGIRLRDLTPRLHELGQALANMGDIDAQRLGGALATGTHGTGPEFGCYSAMLTEMVLFDGRGNHHVLTRKSDEAAFRAMAVGLGTGGILTEAVLRTVAPYRLSRRRYAVRLGDLLADFDTIMRSARNVEFYYIPHSGAAMVQESALSNGPITPRPPENDQKALRQLQLASRIMWRLPRLRRALIGRLMLAHSEERFTEDWHRAFPTKRDQMRFNETEWHLPPETAPTALRQIVDRLEQLIPGLFFPIEVRMTSGDDLYLSPFNGGERVSIAVHDIASNDFSEILKVVEPIFLAHGGRPHWGKMHRLTAAELKPLYPNWDEAIEARRHFDPEGRFLTPYLHRLLGL